MQDVTETEGVGRDGGMAEESETRGETGSEHDADAGAHLDDIEDGCGCAEVWEHMSDRRAED
jgi:hypothetical protein